MCRINLFTEHSVDKRSLFFALKRFLVLMCVQLLLIYYALLPFYFPFIENETQLLKNHLDSILKHIEHFPVLLKIVGYKNFLDSVFISLRCF